jgi:hypothetical protein
MAFNSNDIYTSSGSLRVYNSWTPYVSKFDTSSFYNWEQDNLPLYDLEERTYELWEYAGYPTSAITGLALTVSADTPALTLAQNRNIYTTVSAAIASLPRVIRFPVLIEVANFGDLGALELHDFQIVENGSIEIINRNYVKSYNASATIVTIGTVFNNTYIAAIGDADVSATLFSSTGQPYSTSCVNISSTVFSGNNDVRFSAVNSVLFPKVTQRKAPLSVAIGDSSPYGGSTNRFALGAYETTTLTDLTVSNGYDFSAYSNYPLNAITRTAITTGAGNTAFGLIYGNNLSKISVKNCSGKIYIRNFFVDGKNINLTTATKDGIEILNSDVILENCTAVRCSESGFSFNNSKVILSRGAYSYRNYELSTLSVRTTKKSCGFKVFNSEVIFSGLVGGASTQARDYQASGSDLMFIASRNPIGFLVENSKLVGGVSESGLDDQSQSTIAAEYNTIAGFKTYNSILDLDGLVDVYQNKVGFDLDNSQLLVNELTVDRHTNEGIIAKNSTITYFKSGVGTTYGSVRRAVDFQLNGQHLVLTNNSRFKYARYNNIPTIGTGGLLFKDSHGVSFISNGSYFQKLPGIKIDHNSVGEFLEAQLLNQNTDYDENVAHYGTVLNCTNNSLGSLYGTSNHCIMALGTSGSFEKQAKMSTLYAGANSKISLAGPCVVGQAGVSILAEDNSVIDIGPAVDNETGELAVSTLSLGTNTNHTSVDLHSTRACLVANRNSTIHLHDLGNYKNYWTGTIGSAIADFDYNLGETSAYVGNGSIRFLPNPIDSNAVTVNSTNTIGYAETVNPTFSNDATTNTLRYLANFDKTLGGMCVRALGNSTVNVNNVHFGKGPNASPLDGIFYNASGSDCDRLMIWNIADGSKLTAAHVSVSGTYPADAGYHGPQAYWVSSSNGTTTGTATVTYGAPSGTPDFGSLSVLDIFGAGGSSVSSAWKTTSGVSVNDPFDRFFPVGTDIAASTASALAQRAGIPISGITVSGIQLGSSSTSLYNNQGVFRLYFSPKSECKYLANDLSGYENGPLDYRTNKYSRSFSATFGAVYQIFAQGYGLSAAVSAVTTSPELSSIHPNLLKLSYDSNGDGVPDSLYPSGYYYCKEFLEDDPGQVIIDESAANLFANAKNCSVGMGGRPKRVTIYKAGTDEEFSESNPGATIYGFKSANVFDLKRDN